MVKLLVISTFFADENSLEPEILKEFEDDYTRLCQLMTESHIEEKDKMKELFSICIANRTAMVDGMYRMTGAGLYLRQAPAASFVLFVFELLFIVYKFKM